MLFNIKRHVFRDVTLYFQVDIQLASIAQRYASDLTDSIMSVLSGFSPLVCLVTH